MTALYNKDNAVWTIYVKKNSGLKKNHLEEGLEICVWKSMAFRNGTLKGVILP